MAGKIVEKPNPSGSATRLFVYKKKKKKKKKSSRKLKSLERAVRRASLADEALVKKYTKSHRKSNRKKKDGWGRKLGDNIYKAEKAGWKKLKLRRIVGF